METPEVASKSTPYHPSTTEMVLNYSLPQAKEALGRWIPRFRNPFDIARMPLAIAGGATGLGGLSTAFAQDNPDQAEVQQTGRTITFQKTATDLLIASYNVVSGPSDVTPSAPEVTPNAARLTLYNNLKDLLNAGTFSIDPNEVEAFGNSPDQTVFSTFRVEPNAGGEPVLAVITSGPGGLKPEAGNIQSLEDGIKRLNQIDPGMMDLLTNQYGIRAFGGTNDILIAHRDWAATFSVPARSIFLSEASSNPHRLPYFLMEVLMEESRHIAQLSGVDIPDQYSDNLGIDKAMWFNNWLENHRRSFTDLEYQAFRAATDSVLRGYTENPSLGSRNQSASTQASITVEVH